MAENQRFKPIKMTKNIGKTNVRTLFNHF